MNTESGIEAVATAATEAGNAAPESQQVAGQEAGGAAAGAEGGQAPQPENDTTTDDGQQPGARSAKRPRWSDVNAARRAHDQAVAERDYWRQQAMGQQPQQSSQPAPAASTDKPTLEQFDFDQDAYEDAVFNWRLAQRDAQSERNKALETAQQAQARFAAAQATFAEATPDYDDVVMNPDLQVTPQMAGALTQSDIGPQIAYHLGLNPAEAARIAALSPLQQVLAIGRIEAQLAAKSAEPKPPKPKQTSSAPPPPPTVGGSHPVKKAEGDMTDGERVAAIRAARSK